MKVIIAGSKSFNDYNLLKDSCDFFMLFFKEIEVISGCAAGADMLGELYAKENGYPVKRLPATWVAGFYAGMFRHTEMINGADALIAFWDGKSEGTMDLIQRAKIRGLKVKVVYYLDI